MIPVEHARSLLFAPGDDEDKLRKALVSGADGVIADLEDGVVAARKEAARAIVLRVLAAPAGCARLVRVGSADDAPLVTSLDVDAVVVPKATAESVAALGPEGPPIVAIVETAAGLRSAFDVASLPRVEALMLGTLDLAAELGFAPAGGRELLYARSKLVVDSAAAGIRAPFDGVHPDVRDEAGLIAEVTEARALGFGGKACIHPAQLGVVVAGFAPTAEELDWARSVVDVFDRATATGAGVATLDGAMVDLPVVLRARRLLEQAEEEADARRSEGVARQVLRGLRRRRRLPQPARQDDHRRRQRLVHVPDA